MARIEYETYFDAQGAEIIYTTVCPHSPYVKVGSDDCFRCQHFRAVMLKQQVECGKNVERVSEGFGGFSTSRPCNVSTEQRKPVQMRIQFK